MSDVNPNCDGAHCRDPRGSVRVYPLGGGGNLILCFYCFANENRYRLMRGQESGAPDNWPVVDWNSAKHYPEGETLEDRYNVYVAQVRASGSWVVKTFEEWLDT